MVKSLLNRKQQIFVNEYLIDFNGTRAAKAAGYSERSAYSTAHEILRNPEVKKAIEQKVSELNEYAFLERQRVITRLKEIAYSNPDLDFLSKPSTSDVLKALLLLGKAYGMFWDKPQIIEESKWEKALIRATEMLELQRKNREQTNFEIL